MNRFFLIFTLIAPFALQPCAAEPLALVHAHCVKCHGQDGKVKGKVNLLPFKTLADMQARPVLLEDMIAVLEDREMPPEDEPAMQAADREQLIEALRGLLSAAAKEQAFLATPMRRMNRFQYNNAVVDLLELEELLIKGGYINPDEVLASDMVPEQQQDKMERAAQVFYDHVASFNSDFMSP